MNYKVIIPSYSRPDILCQKTLSVCKKACFDFSQIYVFVLEDQKCSYISAIKNAYPEDNLAIHIISANIPPGLHIMRNYISRYFPDGENLLHMDDDIDDILKLFIDESIYDLKKASRYKLHSLLLSPPPPPQPSLQLSPPQITQQIHPIIKIFNDAFNVLHENNIGLFGIYPVANGYFMKDLPEMTYDLRFCVGVLWGCINDHNVILSIEEKEDVERTIIYYKIYGIVLRLNDITIKTKYYKTPGGMQTHKNRDDRSENAKKSCNYLLNKYPAYTKLYTGKKTGIYEIKLIDKIH